MNDMDDATYWGSANNSADPLTDVSMSSDGDIITIAGKADNDPANEYVYYRKSGLSISTDIHPKFIVRFRTSVASVGLAAQVTVNFSGGGSQQLLGANPQFSLGWTTISGTLTAGKTISSVDIYADDYPDSLSDSVEYTVEYDFILFYARILTFPFISDSVGLKISNVYADHQIPGRGGNISQYLGLDSPLLILRGKMDENTGWHGDTTLDGGGLYEVTREMFQNPWQWLTSDLINCKVTIRNFEIVQDATASAQKTWELTLKKYDLISSNDWSKFPDLQLFGK